MYMTYQREPVYLSNLPILATHNNRVVLDRMPYDANDSTVEEAAKEELPICNVPHDQTSVVPSTGKATSIGRKAQRMNAVRVT